MIKHVGKHGDRRVAIIFRQVPGEDHMCLVVYPDLLKMEMHDALMKAIESPEGQQANQLGEAIHARLFPDGRQMLAALHAESMLKKVQTEAVIVTAGTNNSVRLDELNKIVSEMETGADAAQRMADLDSQRGMTGSVNRKDDYGRDIGAPPAHIQRGAATVAGSDAAGALTDSALAENMKSQAERMAAEAKGLIAESERMLAEARSMLGEPAPKKRGRKPKVANAASS